MEINANENSKIMEFWLTNEEKQDNSLREQLQMLYQQCTARGYLVAVFESGSQNLEDAASGLVCYNCKRIAQLEVEQRHKPATNQ